MCRVNASCSQCMQHAFTYTHTSMCIIIMNEAGLWINNMQWVVSVTHCAINNSTMSYKNYPLRQTENLLLYKTKVFVFINSLVVKDREVKKQALRWL